MNLPVPTPIPGPPISVAPTATPLVAPTLPPEWTPTPAFDPGASATLPSLTPALSFDPALLLNGSGTLAPKREQMSAALPFRSVTLRLGESYSQTIGVEGGGFILMVQSFTGTVQVQLFDPAGELAEPFSASLPSAAEASLFQMRAMYCQFSDAMPGRWQLIATAEADAELLIFGGVTSDIAMMADPQAQLYSAGDTATTTGRLSGSPSNVVITATRYLAMPRFMLTMMPFPIAEGESFPVTLDAEGRFVASVPVTGKSPMEFIRILATGLTPSGVPFEREVYDEYWVALEGMALTGKYSESLVPSPYEAGLNGALVITVEVTFETPSAIWMVGQLINASGQSVGYGHTPDEFSPDGKWVPLLFEGAPIRFSGRDGPYTLTEVKLGPINLPIEKAIITQPYQHTQIATFP